MGAPTIQSVPVLFLDEGNQLATPKPNSGNDTFLPRSPGSSKLNIHHGKGVFEMRTRFHGLVLVLFLGLGTLIAIPTGAAEPVEAKKIDKLIEKLGGDDFNDREKASADLDAIGAPALAALRKATQSKDVEISKRAADLIAKIEKRAEAAKILAPKKIHLVYRATPVPEALADFSKKSGYEITLLDPENKVKDRKMSLDTGDVTFWQALEMFCKEAGLTEMDIQGFANANPGVRPLPIRRPAGAADRGEGAGAER